MSSSDYFLSKLPVGHSITSLTKQAATALLLTDALVLPSFSYKGTLAEMRELCAAALWVHAPNFRVTEVRRLPIAARNTLCRLLDIPLAPNGVAAQSDRVMHTINARLTAAMSQGATASQAPAAPAAAAASAAASGGAPAAAPAAQAALSLPAPAPAGGGAAAAGGGGQGPPSLPPAGGGGGGPQWQPPFLPNGAVNPQRLAGGGAQQAPPPPARAQAVGAPGPGSSGGAASGASGPQLGGGGPPPPPYVPPGGAPALSGGAAFGAGGLLPAAGGAVFQHPAAGGGPPQGIQPPAGGAGPQLQPGVGAAQALPVDGLVTAAQAAIVRALPDAVARMLVGQSGFPLNGFDPTFVVHGKLIVAAWAAEATRKAAEVRALPGPVAAQILQLLGVDTSWPMNLQDVFLDSVLLAGAAAPWATDPSQSFGILNPQRMASLALLASVQLAAAPHHNAEAELTTLLSPLELQALRNGLQAAGRSFQDLVKTGGTWSLPPPAAQGSSCSGGSVSFGASTSSSSVSSSLGAFSTPSSGGRAHLGHDVDVSSQAAAELQCESLMMDTFALLTSAENELFKRRSKWESSEVGTKRERSHPGAQNDGESESLIPLSKYPHNQRLRVQDSFSLSLLGRMLRICLRFCNEHFTDQMTFLLNKGLEEDQAKMYQEFLAAAGSDAAMALCIAPGALQYGRRRMKSVANDSRVRSQTFPSSTLLKFVAEQRAIQSTEFDAFMEAVTRRIASNAQGLAGASQAQCTVLMWQEFLGGWFATSWSSVYCDDISDQWQRLKQSGGALGGHFAKGTAALPPTQSSAAHGGGVTPVSSMAAGASTVAGGAGAGASLTPARQLPQSGYEFQLTIPCSVDIVGETLGTKFLGNCRVCTGKRSHPTSECPSRWQKRGITLPGFNAADSTRDGRAWTKSGKEPLRATIQSWIDFINNPTNWNGRSPVPAGVAGGLSVSDFEKRLPAAPTKP